MYLCFPLLSLLDTLRHYVSSSVGCLYFLIFLCTWFPGGEWPLSSLGNSLFSGLSSFLYRIVGFTFPDAPTDLFTLNLFRGWPKSQTVPLWPMLAGSMLCLTRQLGTSFLQVLTIFILLWIRSYMHMLYAFIHILHIMLKSFLHT